MGLIASYSQISEQALMSSDPSNGKYYEGAIASSNSSGSNGSTFAVIAAVPAKELVINNASAFLVHSDNRIEQSIINSNMRFAQSFTLASGRSLTSINVMTTQNRSGYVLSLYSGSDINNLGSPILTVSNPSITSISGDIYGSSLIKFDMAYDAAPGNYIFVVSNSSGLGRIVRLNPSTVSGNYFESTNSGSTWDAYSNSDMCFQLEAEGLGGAGASLTGCVKISRHDQTSNTRQQQIVYVPNVNENNYFECSVAVSADGSTVAVGVPDTNVVRNLVLRERAGAVYVYSLVDSPSGGKTWSLFSTVVSEDNLRQNYGHFGTSIALSNDGNRLFSSSIGRTLEASANTENVQVFIKDAGLGSYVHNQSLSLNEASLGYDNFFGASIAVSETGSSLVIGAPCNDTKGAAFVYTNFNNNAPYSLSQTIKSESNGDYFGYAVAISSNGSTIGIGSTCFVNNANVVGNASVAIYKSTAYGNPWVFSDLLLKSDASGNGFTCTSLSFNSDGTRLAIGVSEENTSTMFEQGAAYLFRYSSTLESWIEDHRSVDGTYYAEQVLLVPNGDFLLISKDTLSKDALGANNGGVEAYSVSFTDNTSPVSTSLTVSATTSSTYVILNWTPPKDDFNTQSQIQVNVYVSTTNNISTLQQIATNGASRLYASTTGTSGQMTVSGLTKNTTYYFAVVAVDASGNQTLYTPLSSTTLNDVISPIPGNMGIIGVSSPSPSRVDLSWSAATDNISSSSEISYAVYYSLFDNINTISEAESNGTLALNYTQNITSYNVVGLNYNTWYYFNIIAKDPANNKAIYQSSAIRTLNDTTAPTPGVLSVSSVDFTTNQISWTAASDSLTATANLRYAVFMSTSNNITTVANAETNGTMLQAYSFGTNPVLSENLSQNTTYYYNVIVRDLAGNKAAYTPVSITTPYDNTAPVPGSSGVISLLPLSQTSIYLSWSAATDNFTSSANLQYAVYMSGANNISTVADAETNGTLAASYSANRTTFTSNGLNYNTTYYYNVVVKDANGNKASYVSGSAKTLNDMVAPTVGFLSAYDPTMTAISLSWTAASDDFTTSTSIQYAVFRSSANNIGTITNAENNGTLVRSYSTARTPLEVTGLNPSTTYYFTVIARDDAGNKSIYNVASSTTSADNIAPTVGTATLTNISYQTMVVSFTGAVDNITQNNDIQYAIYRSISNNISTVADAETNGVCIRFFSTGVSTTTATDLTSNTTYYFTVVARDSAGNKAAYATVNAKTLADTSAPVPGASGFISTSVISTSRIDLSWTAATDVGSSQNDLQYAVYRSRTNNIATVSTAQANGVLVQNWTPSLTSVSSTGLAVSTSYFFNVLVKDFAGNISSYVSQTATTRSDITPPSVPVLGGVFVSSVTSSSMNLSWNAATDNLTAQSELIYRIYQSRSNNISTVADMIANGTMLTSTANITSFNVTNLAQGTTYYHNVMVIDRFANRSAYSSVVAKTTINSTAPVPGSGGSINASGSASGSIQLSWSRAFDTYNSMINGPANDNTLLEYAVYSAPFTVNNLGSRTFPSFRTVAEIEAIGTKVMDYSTNTLSFSATGLDSLTSYYYNVIVRDQSGNKSAYLGVRAVTLADTLGPVPGSNGLIFSTNITDSGLTLAWARANDDYTQQSRIRYEVRYSRFNNIDTVWTFKNGSIAVPYTADINTANISGLLPNTTYYFNVMAMDDAGNKSVYTTAAATTAQDSIAPTAGNNGTLSFSQISQDQLRISWSKASDTVTALEDLQYIVYQSSFNNISTVALAEQNGTIVSSYRQDYDYAIVTDLDPGTTYWFNVVVKDAAGNKRSYASASATTAQDTVAPTVGNFGSIVSSSVTTSGVFLSWTAASDDYTNQADLSYSLYMSLSNNISSVALAEGNGSLITSGVNKLSHNVTGLTASFTYYFNVVVSDASGNKSAYSQTRVITTVDTNAPSPGSPTTIASSLVASDSVLLNWNAGLDNVTSTNYLQYGVYKSTVSNLTTLSDIDADGELVRPFMTGITALSVKNLSASTQYKFNVVVRDSAGNRAVYSPVSVTTLADSIPPTVGGGGAIFFSAVGKDSMIVSWNHATDNNSFTASIQYELRAAASVDGSVPSMTSVAQAEANGDVVKSYSGLNYATVTGLDSNTLYYFNVIAKDEAGNKVAYSVTSQRTANDLVEISSSAAEINSPVVIASNKDLIKNLPAVAADPTLSKPSNWSKVHLIYKSSVTSKRVVVVIKDFSQMSGTFVAEDAETFYIHKIIIEDEFGNFVSVPSSAITNAENWSLTVT